MMNEFSDKIVQEYKSYCEACRMEMKDPMPPVMWLRDRETPPQTEE